MTATAPRPPGATPRCAARWCRSAPAVALKSRRQILQAIPRFHCGPPLHRGQRRHETPHPLGTVPRAARAMSRKVPREADAGFRPAPRAARARGAPALPESDRFVDRPPDARANNGSTPAAQTALRARPRRPPPREPKQDPSCETQPLGIALFAEPCGDRAVVKLGYRAANQSGKSRNKVQPLRVRRRRLE